MAKKRSVDKPEVRELGNKARTGRVVSEYMRGIASERTECIRNPVTGKKELVSKAEALARLVWEKALGKVWDDEAKQFVTDKPSITHLKLLLERCEGKAGSAGEIDDGKLSVPDKISEINRKRMNSMAGGEE